MKNVINQVITDKYAIYEGDSCSPICLIKYTLTECISNLSVFFQK